MAEINSNIPINVEFFYFPKLACTGSCETKGENGCCVFPFIYKGIEYNSCTTEGARGDKHWCAYSVFTSIENNLEMNDWDYCKDYCKHTDFKRKHNKCLRLRDQF